MFKRRMTEKETILQICKVYRDLPYLWDKNHEDYKNKHKRNKGAKILLRIFKNLDPTATDKMLLKKIQNLRTNYFREQKKVAESYGSAEGVYTPKVYYYEALSFLGAAVGAESSRPTRDTSHREILKSEKNKIKILKQSCISLVTVHNRPLDLFDDEAFRRIVDLLQIEDDEYKKFSSDLVKAWIESEGHEENSDDAGDGLEMEVEALEDSDDDVDTDSLKYEVPSCSCSNRDENDETKHAVACPLAADQPYWGYYEVSEDDATCSICHKKLNWNNFTELKTHLQIKHPSVKFKDDDDVYFEESTAGQKQHSLEEIYFEEDALRSEPDITPTAKKRRISYTSKERAKRSESVRLVDKTDISIDKFKLLDRFGLYVASLLANLPPKKCKKFQMQFVFRLLREQPAAG